MLVESARAGCRRGPGAAPGSSVSQGDPGQRLHRERRAGHRLADQPADLEPDVDRDLRGPGRPRRGRRPTTRAPLETTARPCAADVLEDVLGPAQRPAGHEDDGYAGSSSSAMHVVGVRRDGAVGADQGAVEVGRDEPGQASRRREPAVQLDGGAVVVDRAGDVVGGVAGPPRSTWPIATPRPAHCEHLDVVAAVADREHVVAGRAELVGDVREPGRLGDADRRQVEPGRPADDVVGAVQAEPRGQRRRSRRRWPSGSRMITRLTGPATRSSTSVMIMSPESSPSGSASLTR